MVRKVKPWTWKQIAKLVPNGKRRAAFLKAYGDRAKAALVAADHMLGAPSNWANCQGWHCHRWNSADSNCPLCSCSPWRRGMDLTCGSNGCKENAMTVYARMVAKLGLLPEGL